MAGRGKIGGKKTEKHKFIFSNFFFLEGWSQENRRQKTEKNRFYFFFKTYIFWRLVAGKSVAKNN